MTQEVRTARQVGWLPILVCESNFSTDLHSVPGYGLIVEGVSENLLADNDWVPAACTLPTVEQPLRRAEFDALFAEDVTGVEQVSSERLRFELSADPEAAARAAGLAVKETGCCSFFTFDLSISDGRVSMDVSTGTAHAAVLAALRDRAAARVGGGA